MIATRREVARDLDPGFNIVELAVLFDSLAPSEEAGSGTSVDFEKDFTVRSAYQESAAFDGAGSEHPHL
jgi:hypothetical protein